MKWEEQKAEQQHFQLILVCPPSGFHLWIDKGGVPLSFVHPSFFPSSSSFLLSLILPDSPFPLSSFHSICPSFLLFLLLLPYFSYSSLALLPFPEVVFPSFKTLMPVVHSPVPTGQLQGHQLETTIPQRFAPLISITSPGGGAVAGTSPCHSLQLIGVTPCACCWG